MKENQSGGDAPKVAPQVPTYDPTKANHWFKREPRKGEVYWCLTSYAPPHLPGSDPHPVLVAQAKRHSSELGWEALIVPGSSWKSRSKLSDKELLIGEVPPGGKASDLQKEQAALHAMGLPKATRFQFAAAYWVPFNTDFIIIPKKNKESGEPLNGFLDTDAPYMRKRIDELKKPRG